MSRTFFGNVPAMAEPAKQQESYTQTLPASWYHEPSLYERERQRIFASEWLLYGHEAIVAEPGAYLAQTIAGWPLLVIRNREGGLRAFHNVCRHRASMLVPEGAGKAPALRCMYHGWVYDMEGRLKKAPDFGGDEAALCARTSLFSIHLETWNGFIFVCLADTAPPFAESLGDLPEIAASLDLAGFRYHSTAKHAIGCNWKVYAENYAEGYHIPAVHPGLNREVDFASYRVVPGNRIARHLSRPRAESVGSAVYGGLWVWLWPYAALNVYKDGMNLELMVPTGSETTELQYHFLFRDLADDEGNRQAMAMSGAVTQEDIDICEIVQRNLRAGIYQTGVLSPRHEGGVALFQTMIRKALEE